MSVARTYPAGALERLQAVLVGMLASFDGFCREQGLSYFVTGGTALGARRHAGMIPWDDDVDVGMPYEDYLRFQELALESYVDGCSVHTCENTPGFYPLWTKVFKDGTRFMDENAVEAGLEQGIFLDVFPYRRLDANPARAKEQQREARLWQTLSYLHYFAHPNTFGSFSFPRLAAAGCVVVHRTLAQLWSPRSMLRYFGRALDTSTPGDCWVDVAYPYSGSHPTSTLFPLQEVDFAGLRVRAPGDLHAYLTEAYGDYMELPAPERRHTHTPLILDFGDGVNVMEAAGPQA